MVKSFKKRYSSATGVIFLITLFLEHVILNVCPRYCLTEQIYDDKF